MKVLLALLLLALGTQTWAQSSPATVSNVRVNCANACAGRHAIIFVHGIYGSKETFVNTKVQPSFDWPSSLPDTISGSPVDVYLVEYRTALIAWAKKDIASLDEVVESVYPAIRSIRRKGYASVNFVAHSLGGNVVRSYIHSVKSEEGHIERVKHGFVITLGTPVDGASIANVGSLLKDALGMPDPLLKSLEKDNTFLRMLQLWSRQEEYKSKNYECRPLRLYAGIETRSVIPGVQVVNSASAKAATKVRADVEVMEFDRDHFEIVKPTSRTDRVYEQTLIWMTKEIKRLNESSGPLCKNLPCS